MSPRFGVAASGLRPVIHVGTVSADGMTFAAKADLTAEVMWAVAAYARTHFDGSLEFKVGGVAIDVTVRDEVAS